nr:integrase, catalytic region, zinc finger, CCHC-type, peptidase aspartic, catalytic [Tanacetum cinerariifolium]
MPSNSDDIQAASSNTRPPMLNRTDYDSWDILGTTPKRGVLLGPERPHTYDDLNDIEKKRFDADVCAANIMLQGLPKDIYKLINHNIEAKVIWDNVKMLLAGSELTKEDRESQLYDEFKCFKMLLGGNINEYYVRFYKLVNDMRNNKMTMPNIQLNSKFMNNMSPEWDRGDKIRLRGTLLREMLQLAMGEQILELGMSMKVKGNQSSVLTIMGLDISHETALIRSVSRILTISRTRFRDLALNDDKIFQADECDAFDSDVDDQPTAQSIFMANLSSAGPTNQQAGPSNALILSEVYDLENAIDPCDDNKDEHEIHNKDVFFTVTDSVMTASRFHELSIAYTVTMNRVVELEAENSKLLEKIKNDDHDSMVKAFSKLEVALNLQLKHQHLKENIENFKSKSSKDVPEFDAFFKLSKRDDQIQVHKNTIRKLKAQFSQLKANKSDDTSNLDYKSLDSQNLQLKETVTVLQERLQKFKVKNEKAQLTKHHKSNCVTMPAVKSKVLVPDRYAIDIKPIPPRIRNNREVHLDYLKHLKESVETLCEIVEEVKVERPLDRSLASAYLYTKHSQELLEYVIGVNGVTAARRSQPKSNTTHDRTLQANIVSKKKVEDHHRKNNSKLSKKNRVALSTSVRRTVFNMNSNSLCKTCVQCPLTRKTTPKVLPVKQWKPTGRLIPLGGQCPLVRPTTLTRDTMLAEPQAYNILVEFNLVCTNQQDPNYNWGSNLSNSSFLFMFKCRTVRFKNDHFGAIIGYEDYVFGDSVISKVYYVEGLGHNLFSVGQFCDSDLEVAFRKHTCFIRDLDGVNLIKGSCGSNLYTIYVEDMMSVGITHERTVSRTPQQKDVVERRNRTLVEAAQTKLILSKALMFLWAVAVATACYIQNRSLIHTLHNKTLYELVHDKKLALSFLCVFGALCYPINDSEDLRKLKAKADIRLFVGYTPNRKGYQIYNKCTRQIMETAHVTFDELAGHTVPVQTSPVPAPNLMTSVHISSGLALHRQMASADNSSGLVP